MTSETPSSQRRDYTRANIQAEGARQGATAALLASDPLGRLSPSARQIVVAARGILAQQGYRALSYQRIADAAGVDKGTIRYNFGNKANLVATVVDTLIYDECAALALQLQDLEGEERVHSVVAGLRRVILAADSQRGWFDIVPCALRDQQLRARLSRMYAWWYRMNLEWLGLDIRAGGATDATVAGIAALVAAVVDGLAMQVALDADLDLDGALAALEIMLNRAVEVARDR
jgi:AcrR family transcriptional regulator